MQAEVTFSEDTVGTKTADIPRIFRPVKPFYELRQFIGEGDWNERFGKYEKCINRFSWAIIIASVVYLTPVCINIFTR